MGCATRWGGIRQVAENRLPFLRANRQQCPAIRGSGELRQPVLKQHPRPVGQGADRQHLSYLTLGSPCFNSIRSLYGSGSNIVKK